MVRRYRWPVVMLLLIGIMIACWLGGPVLGNTTALHPLQPPNGPLIADPAEAQRAKQNFNRALREASAGHAFQFHITNKEMTSLVALDVVPQSALPLVEPQVWFGGGKINATGNLLGFGASPIPALIVARPVINSNGQLEIRIEEAQIGHFRLSDMIIKNLTQTINETLADAELEVQIQAIDVLEGELVLTGRRVEP